VKPTSIFLTQESCVDSVWERWTTDSRFRRRYVSGRSSSNRICGWCQTVSLVEKIAEAFVSFVDRFGHFFRTRGRDNADVARAYLRGLAQAEDCTFESMAAVVENGCAQRFQHFISQSPWDHEPVVAQIARDADALLGGKPDSALVIDESSFPSRAIARSGWRGNGRGASARSTIVRSRCSAC
jgi:hypothetical protein